MKNGTFFRLNERMKNGGMRMPIGGNLWRAARQKSAKVKGLERRQVSDTPIIAWSATSQARGISVGTKRELLRVNARGFRPTWFGNHPRVEGASVKKRIIIGGLIVIAVVIAAGRYLKQQIAEETFLEAQRADDGDDSSAASALFQEACEEGSREACQAIRETQEQN